MRGRQAFIDRVEKVLGAVQLASIIAASVALVVLVVTFGWLVFTRYILNESATWVEQLALLLILYIAFLGAGAGVRDDTHLGVTVFRDQLPIAAQKVVMIFIDFLLVAFGIVIVFAGSQLMAFGWDSRLPMLDIPESFKTLAITLCGGLVILHAGARGIIRCMTFSQWVPEPDLLES